MFRGCCEFLLFLCISGIVRSGYAPPVATSDIYQNQDGYGNYDFGYGVHTPHGSNNFRHEKGNARGQVVGSYGLTDADGRKRIVDYVADHLGFRAKVRTNEPGTGSDAYPNVVPYHKPPPPPRPPALPGVYSGGYRYVSSPYAGGLVPLPPADGHVPYSPGAPYKVVSAYPPH